MKKVRDSLQFARAVRRNVLRMIAQAKASHIGSCLSTVDILAVLYSDCLRYDPSQPRLPERDRFLLSKGHAAAALYATLAEAGFISSESLLTYGQNASQFYGHATHTSCPGIEISSGSLGHGLPVGIGIAFGAMREKRNFRTFVMLSDGECDEGSNWEGFLFAPHHKLENLTVIIDYNKIQSFGRTDEVLSLEPFAEKLRAFDWAVRELDGHDHSALREAFAQLPFQSGKPSAIIAHTVKGKGVSFMENDLLWHYRNPSPEQLQQALNELAEGEDDAKRVH